MSNGRDLLVDEDSSSEEQFRGKGKEKESVVRKRKTAAAPAAVAKATSVPKTSASAGVQNKQADNSSAPTNINGFEVTEDKDGRKLRLKISTAFAIDKTPEELKKELEKGNVAHLDLSCPSEGRIPYDTQVKFLKVILAHLADPACKLAELKLNNWRIDKTDEMQAKKTELKNSIVEELGSALGKNTSLKMLSLLDCDFNLKNIQTFFEKFFGKRLDALAIEDKISGKKSKTKASQAKNDTTPQQGKPKRARVEVTINETSTKTITYPNGHEPHDTFNGIVKIAENRNIELVRRMPPVLRSTGDNTPKKPSTAATSNTDTTEKPADENNEWKPHSFKPAGRRKKKSVATPEDPNAPKFSEHLSSIFFRGFKGLLGGSAAGLFGGGIASALTTKFAAATFTIGALSGATGVGLIVFGAIALIGLVAALGVGIYKATQDYKKARDDYYKGRVNARSQLGSTGISVKAIKASVVSQPNHDAEQSLRSRDQAAAKQPVNTINVPDNEPLIVDLSEEEDDDLIASAPTLGSKQKNH